MKLFRRATFAAAWLLLAATAAAKIGTMTSTALVMSVQDPVLGLRVSTVLVLATGIEVLTCVGLIVLRDAYLRGLVLAGLGVQFLIYHAAKVVIAPHGPCPCLGSSWKWLGLTELGATRLALGIALTITAAGVLLLAHRGGPSEAA